MRLYKKEIQEKVIKYKTRRSFIVNEPELLIWIVVKNKINLLDDLKTSVGGDTSSFFYEIISKKIKTFKLESVNLLLKVMTGAIDKTREKGLNLLSDDEILNTSKIITVCKSEIRRRKLNEITDEI